MSDFKSNICGAIFVGIVIAIWHWVGHLPAVGTVAFMASSAMTKREERN